MALENAQYIPELVETNPAGIDPFSQGDDHLRMTKLAVKNSFPGFVGTQTTPKAVTLTEDQINDAALKSAANTFTGTNVFTGLTEANTIRLSNNQPLQGRIAAGNPFPLVFIDVTDTARFGSNSLNSLFEFASGGLAFNQGASTVAQMTTLANGSLQIADSGGVLGNVAAVHKAQTFTGANTFAGSALFNSTTQLANNNSLTGRNAADTANVLLASVDNSDRPNFGDANAAQAIYRANQHRFFVAGGVESAQITDRANGSLLVEDRSGTTKKAGFRNPSLSTISAGYEFQQDDEGKVLQQTDPGSTISPHVLPRLETGTTFRFVHRGSGAQQINQVAGGSSTAIQCFLGGELIQGNLLVQPDSVIEIYYATTSTIFVFGNGISAAS